MEPRIFPLNRDLSSDRTTSPFDPFICYPHDHESLPTEGGFSQPESTASLASLYSHGDGVESFRADCLHFSFGDNTSFTSPPFSAAEFDRLIESMPGLNMGQGSIIVASNDLNCLDETNKSEKSPMEEASASVPNAPPKKSGRVGRPPKRRSVDAHNNTDRTECPRKRLRSHLTSDELDNNCTQNEDFTAKQEATTESPTPELPFWSEDIEKLLSPVDDSPLNGDFRDIIVQYFAACNTHMTYIPDNAWGAESGENTLPCEETSIFILSVDINGHSSSMTIHVARRNAITVGQQCNEDEQTLQQLASRFVEDRLPQPFNNWNDGWTMRHFDARKNDLHYLWVVMNITVGEAAPSFDHQLLRSFLYAILATINHLAGAAEARSAAKRNGDTLKKLWDLFSSTEMIQRYQDNALSQSFEGVRKGIGLAGFADDVSRKTFLCSMANAYRDARASELEPVQAHADHLVVLTDAFCASGMMSPPDQSELDKEEAALRRIEQDIAYLPKAPLNWKDEVAQALGKIADERRKFVRQCWFREALRLVDVPDTATRVNQLSEQVKMAPLQAVEQVEGSNIV